MSNNKGTENARRRERRRAEREVRYLLLENEIDSLAAFTEKGDADDTQCSPSSTDMCLPPANNYKNLFIEMEEDDDNSLLCSEMIRKSDEPSGTTNTFEELMSITITNHENNSSPAERSPDAQPQPSKTNRLIQQSDFLVPSEDMPDNFEIQESDSEDLFEGNEMECEDGNLDQINFQKVGNISPHITLSEDNPEVENPRVTKLAEWAVEYNISRRAVDALLSTLISFGLDDLPKSAKTLLKTPKTASKHLIKNLADGDFWYRGLLQALMTRLSEDYVNEIVQDKYVEVDIFVDGLSPHKSVRRHLWPIAGCLKDDTKPFIIAMWCGVTKEPSDVDACLADFIEEALVLKNTGFIYKNKVYYLKVRNISADAPARAWIRKVNQHGSYNACERCTVKGEWVGGRMTYDPVEEGTLRNDEDFKDQVHTNYHKGDSTLLTLGIKMISQFPIDIMHLVYLGCVKRFLGMLVNKKASKYKLRDGVKAKLSELCLFLVKHTPCEFERKPKSLDDWAFNKAVDLRRILLYEGIVVFQKLPYQSVYKCFMLLSCAMRILVDDDLRNNFHSDANVLLRTFVSYSETLFGQIFIVYNVHHLLHLERDCISHGNPENFSCFKYENNLGEVKNLLRAPGRTLTQVINRTLEKERISPSWYSSKTQTSTLKQPHRIGPVLDLVGEQFSQLHTPDFKFRLNSGDSCCIMKDGSVVRLENFLKSSNGIYLIGRAFLQRDDLFSYPVKSSVLNIYKVTDLGPLMYWRVCDLYRKVALLPLDSHEGDTDWSITWGACIPLLHGGQK